MTTGPGPVYPSSTGNLDSIRQATLFCNNQSSDPEIACHQLSLQVDRKHTRDHRRDQQMFLQLSGQDKSQEGNEGACQRGGGVRHRVAGDTGGLVEAAQNVQKAQRD